MALYNILLQSPFTHFTTCSTPLFFTLISRNSHHPLTHFRCATLTTLNTLSYDAQHSPHSPLYLTMRNTHHTHHFILRCATFTTLTTHSPSPYARLTTHTLPMLTFRCGEYRSTQHAYAGPL